VFLPISVLIWITHTFGWGVLGVLAFSAELIRQHDLRIARQGALARRYRPCLASPGSRRASSAWCWRRRRC
jgi:hypothetical protein